MLRTLRQQPPLSYISSDHAPTPAPGKADTSTPRIRSGLLLQMLMAWKHATMLKNYRNFMHHDVRLVILWMTHLGPLALANVTLKLFVQWLQWLACDPWSPMCTPQSGWQPGQLWRHFPLSPRLAPAWLTSEALGPALAAPGAAEGILLERETAPALSWDSSAGWDSSVNIDSYPRSVHTGPVSQSVWWKCRK